MAARRGLLWLLLLALAAAQTLGLMHRVVHVDGAGKPPALFAQVQHPHEASGPAASWIAGLFSHDDSGCRVFDQLSQGGVIPELPAMALPALVPSFVIQWFQGEALARWAALFDARGPPSVR